LYLRKQKDFENGMEQLKKELEAQAQRESAELTKRINQMRDQKEKLLRDSFQEEANRVRRNLEALQEENMAISQRYVRNCLILSH